MQALNFHRESQEITTDMGTYTHEELRAARKYIEENVITIYSANNKYATTLKVFDSAHGKLLSMEKLELKSTYEHDLEDFYCEGCDEYYNTITQTIRHVFEVHSERIRDNIEEARNASTSV